MEASHRQIKVTPAARSPRSSSDWQSPRCTYKRCLGCLSRDGKEIRQVSYYFLRWKLTDWTGSDLVRVSILGNNIIVVNSLEAASDLLEKRSANYSDRSVSNLRTYCMSLKTYRRQQSTMLHELYVHESGMIAINLKK